MSLSSPYSEVYSVGDGVTTLFAFGQAFTPISANYVKCIVYFADGTNTVPTFTVNMAQGSITIVTLTKTDGTVLSAPPATSIVRIFRDVPESQDLSPSQLQSFTAKQLEKCFDDIVAMIQEVSYSDQHKTLRLTETQRDVFLQKLGEAEDKAILMWDNEKRTLVASEWTQEAIKEAIDYAVATAEEAKEIAVDANAKSEQAVVISLRAETTANTALGNSQRAIETSNTALATSEEAKRISETANDKADLARADASEAKTVANDANIKSNQAVATSERAEQKAEQAVATVEQAVETSEQALAVANSANQKSDTAVATANEASSVANTALSNSQQAISTADSASEKADEALSASARAESKSDNAVAAAGRAESSAAQAVSTSNQALENSEQALAGVQSAVDAAQRATEAAEAAEQAVQEYDGRIQQAQDDASSALSQVGNKQDTLVSGTNIKTVNNESLLGSGNIEIKGGGAVDSVNGKTGAVVLTGEDISADVSELTDTVQGHLQTLHDNIKDIELFKFPNATIIGEPIIDHGQVSGFSESNYLQFPFIVDLHNQPFVIDFCFTTGNDVTTQQNILDSQFGLALAISNGRGLMAISHNGTSWAGAVTGTIAIQPNTTYYARLSWNRILYKTELSTDGTTYTSDMTFGSTQSPYPRTMFIGGCSGSAIGHSAHPFKGSINLNYAYLTVAGNVIWQGMDDAGLSTRANVSLDNLDEFGQAKFDAKQNKLVAGTGITIENDVISSTGGTVVIMRDL